MLIIKSASNLSLFVVFQKKIHHIFFEITCRTFHRIRLIRQSYHSHHVFLNNGLLPSPFFSILSASSKFKIGLDSVYFASIFLSLLLILEYTMVRFWFCIYFWIWSRFQFWFGGRLVMHLSKTIKSSFKKQVSFKVSLTLTVWLWTDISSSEGYSVDQILLFFCSLIF